MKWVYVKEPRDRDHICYISNLSKLREHCPDWDITKTTDEILAELVSEWKARKNWCRVDGELAVGVNDDLAARRTENETRRHLHGQITRTCLITKGNRSRRTRNTLVPKRSRQ